jgi:type II secretory pathway pseudopilin PulG
MRRLARFLPARADRSAAEGGSRPWAAEGRSRRSGAGDTSRRSEAGDTLVEVLMAMMVIGITAVGLLAAFATSISASEQHRSLATDDTILKSYVEAATYQIAQAPAPNYTKCATVASYTAGVDAVSFTIPSGDTGYTVGISSVSYWDGSAFTSTCVSGSTAPQQIMAYATGPSNTSDSLSFIVVDPAFATPVGTASQLVLTTQPPASATAGQNFSVAVSFEDALGNVVSSSAPVTVALGTNPSGGSLSCTTNPVNASGGVATFSCYVGQAGTGYTLTASSVGYPSVSSNPFAITAGSPSQLAFSSAAVSGSASSSATLGPITVQEQDAFGNPTTTAETVNLASSSSGARFAATSGGASITSVTIAAGSSSATLYYGDTKAGTPLLTASATGLSAGTQPETISAAAAAKLGFSPGAPGPGTAGSAIPSVLVQVQDSFGNVVTTANSGSVTLSIATGSAQSSLTSGTTSVGLSSGAASFPNLIVNTAGTYTFTATPSAIAGVTSAVNSSSFTVNPAAASSILISTQPPASVTAGTSFSVGATMKDSFGNLATTSSGPVTLAIATNPGSGTLSCTSNPLSASSGLATFSCSINKSGVGYTLTASAAGATSATTSALTITAGAGTQLVVSSNAFSTTASLSPTAAFTTTLEDGYGNPTAKSSVITVNLSSSSAGTKEFAATSGGTTVSSVTLPANTQSVTAYYGDNKSGSPTITVSGSGLSSGTQSETVNPTTPSKFVFTTGAISGTATSSATLGPITVQEQDTYGNPTTTAETVNLASNSTGTKVFSATSGGTTITSISIPGGSSSATFYYGDTKAATPTITASGSLTSATQVETVSAGSGSKLVITSSAFSATASLSPTSAFTTTLEDSFGNPTTSSTAITVGLGSSSTGTYEFATTSGGSTVTSVTLPANTQSVNAYYGDNESGSPQIAAAATGLTSGTQTETVTAATASKLAFTTQPAGAVHPNAFTTQPKVSVEDTYGNVVTTDTSSVAMAFGTNPTSGSTLTCTTNPVNASAGVATFAGCAISKAGTGYTLKATDGSLTSATTSTFNVT